MTALGEVAWARLPEAVQRRFSKRLADGETVVYQGSVGTTELSRAGRVLAFLLRAIGGPLPRGARPTALPRMPPGRVMPQMGMGAA